MAGQARRRVTDELSRRESRLKKIQQAKAELEKEAEEKAEQERAAAEAKLAARKKRKRRQVRSSVARATSPEPEQALPTPRLSATSPMRRAGLCRTGPTRKLPAGLQRTGGSGCNAQVIVAAEITQQPMIAVNLYRC